MSDQRQVAGQQQNRLGTAFDGAVDAAPGGDVLAFLTRLQQHLGAPGGSELGDFLAARDHEHALTRVRRLHRQLGVSSRQGAPRLRSHRWAEPLLGSIEVLDQDHHPGTH